MVPTPKTSTPPNIAHGAARSSRRRRRAALRWRATSATTADQRGDDAERPAAGARAAHGGRATQSSAREAVDRAEHGVRAHQQRSSQAAYRSGASGRRRGSPNAATSINGEEVERPPRVRLHLRRCALAPATSPRPCAWSRLPVLSAAVPSGTTAVQQTPRARSRPARSATAPRASYADRSPVQPPRTRVITGVSGSSSQTEASRSGSTSSGTMMPGAEQRHEHQRQRGELRALDGPAEARGDGRQRGAQARGPAAAPATARWGAGRRSDVEQDRAADRQEQRTARARCAAAGSAAPARISGSRSSPVRSRLRTSSSRRAT